MKGLIVDLFAGGGGASTGIEAAMGRPVDVAVNHDETALAVHASNHPHTRHLVSNVWDVRPLDATGGRAVDLLWCSPDCRHFSNAKGDVPRSPKVRSLAWVAIRWAKEARPRVIFLENVQEFLGWGPLGADGRPIASRKGETFGRWKRQIERLGYVVDYRILDASHYGAPTRRRRLFLVARRDGLPIRWPEPTHGQGRFPLRTAAECIDWSKPCPSIFERARPLAEKTLWRIAEGIRRFVLEAPAPFLVRYNGGDRGHFRSQSTGEPITTLDCSRRFGLISPTLIQTGFGERFGQAPRVPGLDKPLGTVVAGGSKHALVAAFIARHFGGPRPVVGSTLGSPLHTITAWDHHSLAAVALAKFRGTHPRQPGACSVLEPLPTISAGGIHVAEVRALLAKYPRGDRQGDLFSIEDKRHLGIVTIDGTEFQICDIGMRMLSPCELLRAQFGRFSGSYDLSAATTQTAQIRLIGNSVCPEVAEALVRANLPAAEERAA